MIDDRKVLAMITARGGSKDLPRKNVLPVGGLPLIAWTIMAASECHSIDRLILSSDDQEIIDVARQWGCEVPFVRPAELAGDEAASEAALMHALDAVGDSYDYLVLLQPTSPLREPADIDGCVEACRRSGAPACVAVRTVEKSVYWMYELDEGGRLQRILERKGLLRRRQDLPPVVMPNGAVYVAEVPWFRANRAFITSETVAFPMPAERSLDVDTALDLLFVEAVMAARRGSK